MAFGALKGIAISTTASVLLILAACDGGSGAPVSTPLSRDAPLSKAKAVQTSYDADAKQVEAIIKWASSTWSFISGARTAVDFLTGLDGQSKVSIEEIRPTVVGALRDESLRQLQLDIDGFMRQFHQMQVLALDRVMSGESKETLMTSTWGTTHLRDLLTALIEDGTKLFDRIDPVLREPVGIDSDRRTVEAIPAYTVFVPAWISAMKLAAEIDPNLLKRGYDQIISETLVQSQQTLFNAAGSYLIDAYDPVGDPARFYSPVGADTDGWMMNRSLYRYYYIDPYGNCASSSKLPRNTTGCFSGPHDPFVRYQEIPVVSLALDSLEKNINSQHSMVVAENVYIWDLFSSPVKPGHNVAEHVFADIIRVRQ